MHNIKNKNKSISRLNKKNIYNLPKSIHNLDCLGPCYPPNTIYYHPIYFTPQVFNDFTCPITRIKDKNKDIDRCKEEDVSNDYKEFDIFEPIVHIANTPKTFLEQIYNIISIQDVITFLNNSIDEMPIYSQRRLLDCIYSSFIINNNFPKELFSEKIQHILKTIYDIDISVKKIQKKISSNKNINDIFLYFTQKYSN